MKGKVDAREKERVREKERERGQEKEVFQLALESEYRWWSLAVAGLSQYEEAGEPRTSQTLGVNR